MSPADSKFLRQNLKDDLDVLPTSAKFVPIPGVSWWPSVLTGNLEVEKIHKAGLQHNLTLDAPSDSIAAFMEYSTHMLAFR